jgi:hypothetical protein
MSYKKNEVCINIKYINSIFKTIAVVMKDVGRRNDIEIAIPTLLTATVSCYTSDHKIML